MNSTTPKKIGSHKPQRTIKRVSHKQFIELKPKKELSYIESLATWFETLQFTHFCTFTTSKPITNRSARRIAQKIFNKLDYGIDPTATMFWASEPFSTKSDEVETVGSKSAMYSKNTERFHLHALIRFCDLSVSSGGPELLKKWYSKSYGRCDVSRIRNSAQYNQWAASIYCTKYTLKKRADYDIHFGNIAREKHISYSEKRVQH